MRQEIWNAVKADFIAKWPKNVIDRLDREVKFRTWQRGLSKLPSAIAQVKIMKYKRTGKMT